MKTKNTLVLVVIAAIVASHFQTAKAQDWHITGNAGTNPNIHYLGTTDNKALVFRTQATQRMRIGQGGNVLIANGPGTVLTDVKLQIAGGTNAGLSTGGFMVVGSTTSQNVAVDVNGIMSRFNGSASALYLNEYGGNVYIDRNNTGSRLGIGISAPAAKLHIIGGSDVNGGNGGFIVLGDINSNNIGIDDNEIQARQNGIVSSLHLNASGGDISLREGAMYITSGKLVGIGTESPTNNLHVVGTSFFEGNVGINRTVSTTRDLVLASSIQIGSVESLYDTGSDLLGCTASFVPNTDGGSNSLGISSQRWTSLWATDGTINTSDARDKKNIRDLDYGLKQIMQLHPVKFNWKDEINSKDKFGVIAQEIQKVLPEVVRDYDIKTDEATGNQERVPAARLGVMYADIIPVLIKSIQELEMQIIELRKQINNNVQSSESNTSESNAVISKSVNYNALLEQNAPNPSSSSTTIRYHIPASVSNAQIMVTNATGSVIKTFTLTSKGAGSVTINAGELAAGSYNYTLIIDGKKVDSKQMMIVK